MANDTLPDKDDQGSSSSANITDAAPEKEASVEALRAALKVLRCGSANMLTPAPKADPEYATRFSNFFTLPNQSINLTIPSPRLSLKSTSQSKDPSQLDLDDIKELKARAAATWETQKLKYYYRRHNKPLQPEHTEDEQPKIPYSDRNRLLKKAIHHAIDAPSVHAKIEYIRGGR